ncbi:MAG TPA: glycine cleavage system aminomethyltransferase GcvT [Micropepsaceae bacterium]|nr:glycine cleavage system aminomethyltransferase GcvT [Micropepsaceae bacterium]
MAETGSALKRTPLHALHVSLGARMVPFAGYEMPVQYRAGILNEHLHTRKSAGLFDVSHMGQAFLHGSDPARALELVTPADVAGLRDGHMRYGLLLNPAGGIRDDFMVARLTGRNWLYLVVNASTKDSDFVFIAGHVNGAITIESQAERALLALQGPMAERVLSRHAQGTDALTFLKVAEMTVAGVPAIVSRSGYTGEDGFEISLAAGDAERVAQKLLAEPEVLPVGLGARDTLRLEAGLCLYGHDIDETTNPIEADLAWTIGKRRKMARDFPAAERIMGELMNGPRRKRVGLTLKDKTPAREGAELVDATGGVIGRVTSGGFGPSAGVPIAMGYVAGDRAADGTELAAMVRGTARAAVVSPLPFVPHHYVRKSG